MCVDDAPAGGLGHLAGRVGLQFDAGNGAASGGGGVGSARGHRVAIDRFADIGRPREIDRGDAERRQALEFARLRDAVLVAVLPDHDLVEIAPSRRGVVSAVAREKVVAPGWARLASAAKPSLKLPPPKNSEKVCVISVIGAAVAVGSNTRMPLPALTQPV
jgi:hypothetical protein